MFAVMGATGNVGGAVIDELLRQGRPVRAIVRSPEKADALRQRGVEIAVAEYDDEDALAAAWRGTEGVFVMLPPNIAPAPGFPDSMRRIDSIRTALEVAKPQRYVALSTIGAEQTTLTGLLLPLHALEDQLGALHLPAAFLRAAWFMENFRWDIPAVRENGRLDSFLHPLDKCFPMVATTDVGTIAAHTLLENWKYTRYLDVLGPRPYSPNDIASIFGEILGEDVKAVEVPRNQWQKTFVDQGMPGDRTHARIEMLDGLNSGWISFNQPGTEHANGSTEFKTVLERMMSMRS